jgi:hypothetical protein
MRMRTSSMIGALLSAVTLAVAIFNATPSSAQPLTWSPPCGAITVYNLTGCPAELNLITTPAGAVPTITIPSCPGMTLVSVPASLVISYVITLGGTLVPLIPAPPFPPAITCPMTGPLPSTTADRVVHGVTLGPSGCCFDIYFYMNDPYWRCTVFLVPGVPPCVP